MKQNTVNYEVSLWIVLRTPLNERVVVASRLSTQPKYRKRKREQKKTQKTRNKCQTHNCKREFTNASKGHRLPRLHRITLLRPHRFRKFIASLPQPRFDCPSGGFVRVGRRVHATHSVLHTMHTSRRVLPTVHRLHRVHASHRRVLHTSSRVNPTQTKRIRRIINNDIRNVPPEPRDWVSRF